MTRLYFHVSLLDLCWTAAHRGKAHINFQTQSQNFIDKGQRNISLHDYN
jgi:hypothetical protein